MTLKEEDIIQNLGSFFPDLPQGVLGIGDDAALLPAPNGESYVISKDQLVENIHFRLSYGHPENLAHKALHVNLSDMAAMGALPAFVMLGLAVPPGINPEWVRRFSENFAKEAQAQNIILIGGDTTASPREIFISITIIGRAPTAHIKYRHSAKVGDIICVAGLLGEAYAGLLLLENKIAGFEATKNKTLQPIALVPEGLWLGEKPDVTAMMDISDGLHTDLGRMAQKSGIGAEIHLESLHPSEALIKACTKLDIDPVDSMLTGGEDYALLFTVRADAFAELAKSFEQNSGYALKKIGVMTEGEGITLKQNGAVVPFHHKVFSHFGES